MANAVNTRTAVACGTTRHVRPLADSGRAAVRPPSAWRRAVAALSLVIGVLVVTGCGSSQGASGQSLGAQVLQNPSPFEMRVLKDKHVTQAEFDESTQIYIECLKAAGLQVEIQPDGAGIARVWAKGTGAPSSNSGNPVEKCAHQIDAVQNVWVLQSHVSASDIDRMQAQLVSCLRDAGLPIKDGSTFNDAERALSDFMASLGSYDDNSPQGVTADKAGTCQQDYQGVSGAQPLPGLQEALDQLDTSGW